MTDPIAGEITIFFVGSGAVTGAWLPVVEALRTTGFRDLVTAEGANFAMARLVYVARLAHLEQNRGGLGKHRHEINAKLTEAKHAIADALVRAETDGTLHVRPEFASVMKQFVLVRPARFAALVTTNWDRTIERAARGFQDDWQALHVHGSVADPEHLYLPTELVEEPYRTRAQRTYLKSHRGELTAAIGQATRIVVYGLALSPLDPELGQVIASGVHHSHVREISVVDPNYVEVAERFATLDDIGSDKLPIHCWHPSDLTRRWTYQAQDVPAEREVTRRHN
jgi:hypothetical protein